MNTSIGLPSISDTFYVPKVVLDNNPKDDLNSSSETAVFISILFPKITVGTFANSGVFKIDSNSFLDSSNLAGSAESTK